MLPNLEAVPSTLPEAAAFYARAGWAVIPLRPRGKTPLTPSGFKDASADVAQVAEWWATTPGANIGFVPGRAGLVVIDVDGPEGRVSAQALGLYAEPTAYVVSGRPEGGEHLYFVRPREPARIGSAKRLGEHLDIRADAGLVLLPPSIHPGGAPYLWGEAYRLLCPGSACEFPCQLPPLARDKLAKQAKNGPGSPAGGVAYLPPGVGPGNRNTSLFKVGCALRSQGRTHAAIEGELLRLNKGIHPPLGTAEVRRIARNASGYQPSKPRGLAA